MRRRYFTEGGLKVLLNLEIAFTEKNEKWQESHPKQSETELIAFVIKYYLGSFLATDDITIVRILFSLRIPTFTELIKVFIKVKWANVSQNLFGIQKLKPIRSSIVRTAKKRFLKKSESGGELQ